MRGMQLSEHGRQKWPGGEPATPLPTGVFVHARACCVRGSVGFDYAMDGNAQVRKSSHLQRHLESVWPSGCAASYTLNATHLFGDRAQHLILCFFDPLHGSGGILNSTEGNSFRGRHFPFHKSLAKLLCLPFSPEK